MYPFRLATLAALCLAITLPIAGGAAERPPRSYDIDAQPLGNALSRLAVQSRRQILFSPSITRGKWAPALHGPLSITQALTQLLAGTGLVYRMIGEGVILVEAPEDQPAPALPARRIDASPSQLPQPTAVPDMVVTALKRPTLLMDTALSMAVLAGDTLADRNIRDLQETGRFVPGLNFTEVGPGQRRTSMRGVYGTGEATVGVYYDETPVTGPAGTTFDPSSMMPNLLLVDVDRVEILRGPQGTLYGSGSMGGTIRVIFNKPNTQRWSGSAGVELSGVEHGNLGWQLSGTVNAAIVPDRLAARVVGFRRETAGYIDNVTLRRDDINRGRDVGGRLSLAWSPVDRLSLTGTAVVQRSQVEDAPFWHRGAGAYRNDQTVRVPYESDIDLYNLTLRWGLGPADLVATSSHYRWEPTRRNDYSLVLRYQRRSAEGCQRYLALGATASCTADELDRFAAYVDGRLPALLHQPMAVRSWTHELRLTAREPTRFHWTIGSFFERRRDTVDSLVLLVDPATGEPVTPFDMTGWRTLANRLDQGALFGELSVDVTRKLSLTAGLRYFHYERQAAGEVPLPNVITGTDETPRIDYASVEDGWIVKLAASYRPTDDLLLYAQASQGFRPGGVNLVPGLPAELVAYQADHLWSYELGAKSTLLRERIELQAGLYHVDWINMIYPATSLSGAFGFNTNIGAAEIDGGELELTARPTPGLELSLGLNYVDARLSEDQTSAIAIGSGRKGDRIPTIPRLSGNIAARYVRPLTSAVDGVVGATATYVSRSYSQFNERVAYQESMGGHAQVDVHAGLRTDRWEASLFVRNLTGDIGTIRTVSNGFGIGQIYSMTPRSWGLAARFGF